MYILKLVIQNFKKLRDITVELNEKINIIVGDDAPEYANLWVHCFLLV